MRLMMSLLVIRAFKELVIFDLLTLLGGYPAVRMWVLRSKRSRRTPGAETVKRVVDAVDIAGCFYVREVRCLHRSFAAARLLRTMGIDAELIIAARPLPFLSHSWVEVNNEVVNDRKTYKQKLLVMERL